MTVGLVIAGVAVVGIVLLVLRWRMASGEQQALRHYQNALDTLRTVSDRMESSRPAVLPTKQADEEPSPGSSRRPGPRVDLTRVDLTRADLTREDLTPADHTPADHTPAAGTPAYRISETRVTTPLSQGPARNGSATAPHVVTRAGTDRTSSVGFSAEPESASAATVVSPGSSEAAPGDDPRSKTEVHPVIVFEEDDSVVDPANSRSPGLYGPARPTRSSRRALQRSSRPSSRVPAVLGVVVAVVVIAVAVVVTLGATSHHHTTSPPVHSQTTAPAHNPSKTTAVSTVPPTIAPPTIQPEAATATVQSASYAAPSSAYTVTLSSSGACWVYAKLASTGAVVWTGTLDSGQAQTLDATGGLIVELGHANTLSATLNGVPVEYPAQYQAVFTMTFVPTVA